MSVILTPSPGHSSHQGGEGDPPPPLSHRPARLPLPGPRGGEVLLPLSRERREVPRRRPQRARRAHVRALARPAAVRDGPPAVLRAGGHVQGLQPRQQAGAVRVRVRRVRDSRQRRRQVGAPAGVPLCQNAAQQRHLRAREGPRQSRDAHPHLQLPRRPQRGQGEGAEGDEHQQRAEAAAAAGGVAASAAPRHLQAAVCVRERQLRQVHPHHGLPEGRQHGQELHVHHHAGGRPRQPETGGVGRSESQDCGCAVRRLKLVLPYPVIYRSLLLFCKF